jgi:hypothetical protein
MFCPYFALPTLSALLGEKPSREIPKCRDLKSSSLDWFLSSTPAFVTGVRVDKILYRELK